ncbi:MAG: CRTAC1 family protein [Fimbriimonadaceae bacterium]|nr:CRTAC1 family protein [Fimbriimonadaceae bacterium]
MPPRPLARHHLPGRAAGLWLALLLAGAAPGQEATFRDQSAAAGLTLDTNAACWADLNNDGRPDLVAGGAVWWNESPTFRRGPAMGAVVAADYDHDGFRDLFCWSQWKLYHNDAGAAFTPVALEGVPQAVSRGACWADFDNDGWLDLYVGGYEDWNAGVTWPTVVLQNLGGSGFKVALTVATYRTRGVTAADFDEDGDDDLYVSNYRLQPNQLWLNDAGRLRDVAAEYGVVATSSGFNGGHSIGAAWGDFDNDGRIDLFAGNFAHVDSRGDQPKSRFLRNLGAAGAWHFEDRGPCGVFYQESYATPAAGDYDNDGDLDLFFTTVYGTASFGRPNHPVLYRNDGAFTFADTTAATGLAGLPPTYQAAWADYDGDGDLDLVGGGRLWQNQSSGRHWLAVRLRGSGRTNHDAIGAQVRLRRGEQTLTRQVEAGTGEGNQNDLTLHFGLGDSAGPVDLQIRWPGRPELQTVAAVAVDQQVAITAP